MAYQLELPMIATNVGALGCTVENSGTGLLVSTPDAQEIAGKITEFFSMDSHELFMQNLKKEKIRLSWANFTRSTESFLSEIVAS